MLASCGLAFVLPFELVLFSYAFLGPAHYLTQISWMHDRQYFVRNGRWVLIPAALLSLAVCSLIFVPQLNDHRLVYALYTIALSGASALVFARNWAQIIAFTLFGFAGFMGIQGLFPDFMLGVVLLLPTVLHIYVFTGAFILLGAVKNQSRTGYLSFLVFCVCGAVFFFITLHDQIFLESFVANNIQPFDDVANYLADLFSLNGWIEGHAMLGFLSFAYTYHYLNWFSKVEIIKWHEISRKRLIIVAALYAFSVGLYIYDYRIGLLTLVFLSLSHVILEFPLNVITFKTLALEGKNGILRLWPSGKQRSY